jgi:predicted HTH transcriptional regulator
MSNQTLAVLAALLVLFSALLDPRVSLIIAVAALILLAVRASRGRAKRTRAEQIAELNAIRDVERQAALERIMALYDQRHELTNDDVQEALAISDATATRYLDELEREGRIKQVGETGRGVMYWKV